MLSFSILVITFLSLYWIIDRIYILFAILTIFLIISIILYKKKNTWDLRGAG
jgi:hypothetical protein